MTIELTVDEAAVMANVSGTGGIAPYRLSGIVQNGVCNLRSENGGEVWEGRCDAASFAGTIRDTPQNRYMMDGHFSAAAIVVTDLHQDFSGSGGGSSGISASGKVAIDYAATEKSGGNVTIPGVSERWPAGKGCSIGDCLLFDFTPRAPTSVDYKKFGEQISFGAQRIVTANGNGEWGNLKILGVDDSKLVLQAGYSRIIKAQWIWQGELHWPVYFKFINDKLSCFTMHGMFDECRSIPSDGEIAFRNWALRIDWPTSSSKDPARSSDGGYNDPCDHCVPH